MLTPLSQYFINQTSIMKRFTPLFLNIKKTPISIGSLFILLFFLNPWNATAQTNNLPLSVDYPMIDDLLDATGNFGPVFLSDPSITSVGQPVCIMDDFTEYARTPVMSDLDWTNFGYSIDVNISAYPNSPSTFKRGGSIATTSTSFRNSAIWLGESGELGILYNNVNREYSNTILNLNQWYNIEFYFENETAYLYLDGVLVFTFNTGPLQTSVVIGSNTINADKTLSTRNFGGGGTDYDRCVRNMKVYFEPSCVPSITCPNSGTFECGDDTSINAWLASATAETCNLPGTTVSNNYDPMNFSGCNSTGNITFSLTNSAGQVIADCVTSLTIDDNTAPSIVCPPDVTIDCGGGGASFGLLITEADPNSPDFVEIQNFSNNTEDYTGWFVAISDSYFNINVANSIVWELGVMAPNEIDFRSDNSGLNPWGNNIFWNSTSPSWAILVDNNGNVADVVFWGWSEADIAGFNATINGFNITIPNSVWSGDGISGSCPGLDSRNRQGTSDNNDASDWFCTPSTIGVANPGLNITPSSGGGGAGGNGTATATDACDSDPSVSFTDIFVPAGNCPQAGVITRTWIATDACGNTSNTCQQTITINPPAAPTVTAPSFPATIACADANAFVAPNATYTNGLENDCELAGELVGTVTSNFDGCGGTITVNYSGVDACNNTLTAGPFTINVDPAPAPTITSPSLPAAVSCATADGYSPPNATYSNGLTGACNISGTIAPTVTSTFNRCGGIILVSYSGTSSCGQEISLPSTMIEVYAAPTPSIIMPTLPTSLTCEEAATYSPPTADITNGLTGLCNISGTLSASVTNNYDACGGNLVVTYHGEDDCGRNVTAEVQTIMVEPAAAPTIMIPNFPTSMSCAEAESFVAPITSYDNGLTGACNNSGLIESYITLNVDACSGGTLTIQFNGLDNCDNQLTSDPIVIQVEPAPPAVLSPPEGFLNNLNCWEVAGYYPGNATFTNGNSGVCGNSGEIEPIVTELWNTCDGGFIIYDYIGTDNCGNELNPIVLKVSILPDTYAPVGECVPFEGTVSSIEDIPDVDQLQDYFDQVAAGYIDYCGDVVVEVIGDTGVPQCDEQGTFERIYTVEVSDKCGNVIGECSITFSGNCDEYICTLTQKFYGNPDDELFGVSSSDIVNTLIDNGNNPIAIGYGNCVSVIDDLTCIQDMLNSFGPSVSLPSGFGGSCDGTSSNALVNQILTTTLNIRYNQMMNPNGQIDFGGFLLSDACMNIPGFISNNLPANPNVNDLLKYANDFIACQCTSTCGEYQPNMAELTNLFWGLNSRFNRCHVPGPCPLDLGQLPNNGQTNMTDNTSIELYPNPTSDLINLKLVDGFGKTCTLEIFDALGQKVGEKVYQDLDQNVLQIDVQRYQNGMHWITIELDGFDRVTKKFMIVK